MPSLSYERHLFEERTLTSVTANTRRDGVELLDVAERAGLRVVTTTYAFEEADRALGDLAADHVNGAAVIRVAV